MYVDQSIDNMRIMLERVLKIGIFGIPFLLTAIEATAISPQKVPIWPPVTCHKWYEDKVYKYFTTVNERCKMGTASFEEIRREEGHSVIRDSKGCIASQLHIAQLNLKKANEHETGNFFHYNSKNFGMQRTIMRIFGWEAARQGKYTDEENVEREEFIRVFMKRTENCDNILEINYIDYDEEENYKKWLELYKCIEEWWGCTGFEREG